MIVGIDIFECRFHFHFIQLHSIYFSCGEFTLNFTRRWVSDLITVMEQTEIESESGQSSTECRPLLVLLVSHQQERGKILAQALFGADRFMVHYYYL